MIRAPYPCLPTVSEAWSSLTLVSDEELDDPPPAPHPLTHITRTTYLILNKSLTTVIGQMQKWVYAVHD